MFVYLLIVRPFRSVYNNGIAGVLEIFLLVNFVVLIATIVYKDDQASKRDFAIFQIFTNLFGLITAAVIIILAVAWSLIVWNLKKLGRW